MQLIVQLDAESARQLELIQEYTNQNHNNVIQQALSLYYQQIQPHYRVRLAASIQHQLVSNQSG